MRLVKGKNLKKGQIVVVGELGKGKFDIAEVDEIIVNFKNWKKFDMNSVEMKNMDKGFIDKKVQEYAMQVLNSQEIKKAYEIENKIKMLNNLDDVKAGKESVRANKKSTWNLAYYGK